MVGADEARAEAAAIATTFAVPIEPWAAAGLALWRAAGITQQAAQPWSAAPQRPVGVVVVVDGPPMPVGAWTMVDARVESLARPQILAIVEDMVTLLRERIANWLDAGAVFGRVAEEYPHLGCSVA